MKAINNLLMEEEGEKKQINKEEERLASLRRDLDSIIPRDKEEEGKLEFLKREEIRTMAKDVKRLREEEAQKEKERIVSLGKERDKPKEPETAAKGQGAPDIEKQSSPKTILIPRTPQRKFVSLKKIVVRIVFVLLFAGLIFGAYRLISSGKIQSFFADFFTKKSPPQEQQKQKEGEGEQEEGEGEKIEISIPPSFVPIEKTISIEIGAIEEIPGELNRISSSNLVQEDFSRIVFKNPQEKRLVDLKEITRAFAIDAVPEVMEKLKLETFSFLLFPQKEGVRQVVIAEIKEKEGLGDALIDWEQKITKEGLYISGSKVPAVASSFKNYSYYGTPFRYLTIDKQDLGLCYTVYKNTYVVLSSSFQGINHAIEKLDYLNKTSVLTPDIQAKMGQLFIVGFEGTTVTPQLEAFFRNYKPGGILLLSKNIENEEQLKALIQRLQDISSEETGLPLFVAVDQEGGEVSRIDFLEEKTPQSEIQFTDEAYNIGLKRGQELKELGVNVNLAPLLDDMKEEDFYYERTFKKPADLAGDLAKRLIEGQKQAGILTAIKHYPGYVGVDFNPESGLATLDFPETIQFSKTVQAEPEFIMTANAVYNSIDASSPLTFSTQGINYLKNNLNTEALIISDDLAQNSLLNNFSLSNIVSRPIEAGVDILIFSGWRSPVGQAMDVFFEAANSGKITKTKVEQSISKIINLKQILL